MSSLPCGDLGVRTSVLLSAVLKDRSKGVRSDEISLSETRRGAKTMGAVRPAHDGGEVLRYQWKPASRPGSATAIRYLHIRRNCTMVEPPLVTAGTPLLVLQGLRPFVLTRADDPIACV